MISLESYRCRIGSYLSRARFITVQSYLLRKIKIFSQDGNYSESISINFFLLIVYFSMYTNFQMLILAGDIESNPGPSFKVLKSTFGAFNQGDTFRFGDTAGIQCACNSLVAICWSSIRRVGVWKPWDIDNILEHGDTLHKTVGKVRSLALDELPGVIEVCNHPIQVVKLRNDYGLFPHYWETIDILADSISECDAWCVDFT